MSFLASKLFWAFVRPGTLLFLVIAAAFLLARRHPAASQVLLGLAVIFAGAMSLLPVVYWAASPLEARFPQAVLPEQVTGIVVLGSALSSRSARHPSELNDAADRITEALVLARRYPNAKLMYSGGSGELRDQADKEADVAGKLFESLGVDPARLLLERESRNTWENAKFSKVKADPKPGETWILVTSAWHMPRAVGCFRRAGWSAGITLIPDPVDYIASRPHWAEFQLDEDLASLQLAVKEWLGLVAYRLMGRTDALLPAPSASP